MKKLSTLLLLTSALVLGACAGSSKAEGEEMEYAEGQNMPGDTVMTDEDYVEPGETEFEKVSAEDGDAKTPDGRVLEDDPRIDEDGTIVTENITAEVDPNIDAEGKQPTPTLEVTDRDYEGSKSSASLTPKPDATEKSPQQDILPDKKAPLTPVYFEEESAELDERDRRLLVENATWLRNHPRAKIVIEGHASEPGPNGYNDALARKRAKAVQDYLVSQGVSASQLTISVLGEATPTTDASAKNVDARDRRVDFARVQE